MHQTEEEKKTAYMIYMTHLSHELFFCGAVRDNELERCLSFSFFPQSRHMAMVWSDSGILAEVSDVQTKNRIAYLCFDCVRRW